MTIRSLIRGVSMIAAIALAATLAGCGYTTGSASGGGSEAGAGQGYQWKSLYRGDVNTVAVPIFTNRSYRRGVEFNLTNSVIKALEAHSPYKVTGRESADTILEGEIVYIDLDTISSDADVGIPQEQLYTVAVNFTWKDLRSGKILVERRRFEQTAPYYPTLGEDQFVGSQQNVERLGLAIVQELQADW